jgi:lysophospholipase L1-like esterase
MQNRFSLFAAWFVAVALTAGFPLSSPGQDVAATAAATPAAPTTASDTAFFFHDGDTPAVFLGDSITEQKQYTTLIETYTLTRFPTLKITFRNAGWGGDTSWLSQRGDFDTGLQRDVLSLKPKSVTIDFGMNDARGGDGTYAKYLESTTKLVKDIEKSGARIALITPSPEERYELTGPAGSPYNLMLKKYSDGLKVVADNEKVLFIDQYTPFVGYIEAGRKAGVLSTSVPMGDPSIVRLTNEGVHPNWGGHLIMATVILQGLHAPADVSSVTIDAGGHSIIAAQGCSVDWQTVADVGVVQFKRTDEALPWPIPVDPRIDTVLKIPGFDPAQALNRYGLTVSGLKEANYVLFIDNDKIDTYSSADLAKGINLGFVPKGPIYEQGQQLLKAVMAKNDDYFQRWRNVQVFKAPDWLRDSDVDRSRVAELARLDAQISTEEANIESLRKPVSHIFKLVPAVK